MAKPTAAAAGALGAAVNVAGSDILPEANSLYGTSSSELSQYGNLLEGFLSANPTMRLEANAPLIAQDTALGAGEKQQIMNQPRGGAEAYELAQVDQSTATAIGNALSQSFNTAVQGLGTLGQWGTTTALNAQEGAAGVDVSAGGGYINLSGPVASGDAQTTSEIEQAVGLLAGL